VEGNDEEKLNELEKEELGEADVASEAGAYMDDDAMLGAVLPVQFNVTRKKLVKVGSEQRPEDLAVGRTLQQPSKAAPADANLSNKKVTRAAKPRGRKLKGRNKDVDPYNVQAHTIKLAGLTITGSVASLPDGAPPGNGRQSRTPSRHRTSPAPTQ
jgi:hypothetical protein